jgi:5,5'-dehydrodivanillate O-demethylase
MLTAEQNDTLTHVLPGTRMGRLMRRYWHPVAASAELVDSPVKAVRILGESLVLYRDGRGELGLLAEACAHRGASLTSGNTERHGLRCSVHRWLYASDGRCLEQPMEEPNNREQLGEARTTAYAVEELGGLVFAYMGPEPRPLLPRYNVLVWQDAVREIQGSLVPCNWLQVMENLLDPMHVEQLHGRYFADVLERKGGASVEDFLANHCPPRLTRIGFERFADGIIERHMTESDREVSWDTGTPSFFPTTTLVQSSAKRGSVIFIVPFDDTHTWFLLDMAERTGFPSRQKTAPFVDVPGRGKNDEFLLDTAHGQDHMAAVTQGAVAPRADEHLGTADAGIVLYRELLSQQMERVESGRDPMNVRRSRAENEIIDAPRASAAASYVDTSGWSRQRRRWAERHPRK